MTGMRDRHDMDDSSQHSRVEQLVDELLVSQSTPEVLCVSCPELLGEVRKRWFKMRRLRADLEALFPSPDGSAPEPLVGQSLPKIPGYDVEGVLGHGGMGVVFRARHLRLNRLVALKMSLGGAYCDPHERQRFQRESEAVAGLRHANIAQVYDAGEADGRSYFTMELVEGGSLAEKLRGTPQPAHQAAALVATLADAIHMAHESGIVHRDLKPANVLLTPDGTPKIADFGVARRLRDGAALTQSGVPMGTPSYMAPEQARGQSRVIGPAVDVYALGAILYELLTGRPPFRGETPAETVLQVISLDPVPPSRLNSKVPRDLETICLKCLQKAPQQRYASAAALGDDLRRFVQGEAIAARPESRLERLARRMRRRPGVSALVAASAIIIIALLGGGLWLLAERGAAKRLAQADQAAVERATAEDISDMQSALRREAWPEATAALERARGRLGDGGSAKLRNLLGKGDHDLGLASQLDAIRLAGAESAGGKLAMYHASDEQYASMFERAGLGPMYENAEVIAARVRASNIASALIAALDHWSTCTDDVQRRDWILSVARRADDDPTGWRDRARDPLILRDEATLSELIETARFADESVALLLALESPMLQQGQDTNEYLRKVQRAHPSDFWINFRLGDVLRQSGDDAEALRYLQAAEAIRPKAAIVHHGLGWTLAHMGETKEALEHLRLALEIDPTATPVHSNLALTLLDAGQVDEAIEHIHGALKICPEPALLHSTLARCLETKGRQDEALTEARDAVTLDAKNPELKKVLTQVLLRCGQADEARTVWESTLALDPPEHEIWYGYAELCLYLGDRAGYQSARRALLAKFAKSPDPYVAERTSRACLLLPADGEELRTAVALAEKAVQADPSRYASTMPHFLFSRGLADYRLGRYESAIETMRTDASQVLGPAPALILAMALYQTGKKDEARKTLSEAIAGHDWSPSQARYQDGWIFHILRREAERLILPDLNDFLDGKYVPRDNEERLALIGICQASERHRAVARLYAGVFEAAPELMDDVRSGYRYYAARALAQAGCGVGTDAAGAEQEERARCRAQSREWLRADLTAFGRYLASSIRYREAISRTLTRWRADLDLACVRDPEALKNLPADERKEFQTLWADVDALLLRTKK
jgi:serine/threonine-protein kinase